MLVASNISENEVRKKIKSFNGIAIPAHIDREGNGMAAILGDIPKEYSTVEFSNKASKEIIEKYKNDFNTIIDSDAHCLKNIGNLHNFIYLEKKTTKCLIKKLSNKKAIHS